MKYRVQSNWTMTGVQFIEADSAEEAEIESVNGPLPLPENSEYLGDSFRVTDVEVMKDTQVV